MRELLKEAARELGAVQYYIPPADETVEMTHAITADVDACQRLAERLVALDALIAQAKPEEMGMPETYTQEQIEEAKKALEGFVNFAKIGRKEDAWPIWDEILLSALSTAERERDENKSKAEQYYKDWYASKAEFGDITAKLRDRVRTAEAQVAELEARLQGAAERGVEWQEKLCKADDWSCKDCTECAELRAAIVGKEGEE